LDSREGARKSCRVDDEQFGVPFGEFAYLQL
jgi:hypothetical protein